MACLPRVYAAIIPGLSLHENVLAESANQAGDMLKVEYCYSIHR